MSDYVHNRLNSRIIEVINTLIVNGDIKNPNLSKFASITDVSLSKDGSYATLYVNCLDDKALSNSVKALQSASGYIQSRLASVLKTKNTPRLTFMEDECLKNAMHMDALIDSLNVTPLDETVENND